MYGLRMYTRARLTRNLWWDDWSITVSLLFTLTFSVMWSVYAGRGYARHEHYLGPAQRSDAGRLSVISRSCCIMAIAFGKVSVAFLIQRIQAPGKWRIWFLRFCSASVFITALFALIFLFAQCQPAKALWTPSMIKNGTGHCWNPIPVNNYDIVIAGYFAFLDFALAILPVDIIWKLQIATKKKLLLCALLGMGIFAGVCAAIKTSQLRTVTSRTDITCNFPRSLLRLVLANGPQGKLAEYLLWNALEVNVIIIAACIPTLRPLFLVVFKRAGAEVYLKKSYRMTPKTHSGYRAQLGRSTGNTDSIISINQNDKAESMVDSKEVPGHSDCRSHSRNEDPPFDEEVKAQGDIGNADGHSANNDEREKETQHLV
ncbi:MAG: hypothetical protein Q9220_003818 [cf. Caloplaca sp. 1 TL-2023]